MVRLLCIAILALTSTLFTSFASAQDCKFKTIGPRKSKPVATDGWDWAVIANNLGRPRTIVFDTEGSLLVLDSGDGITHLKLEDQGGRCLRVKKRTVLLRLRELNHGLVLSKDGRTIYASTEDRVFAWPYNPENATVNKGAVRTIVKNMKVGEGFGDGFVTRTLLISEKYSDMMLISRGSKENDDPRAEERLTGLSQIRAFNISAFANDSTTEPLEFLSGKLLAWGLRNSVGMAEHPETGGLFSVEQSAYELNRDKKSIDKNNPAEEMNFHGFLNGSTESQGGNYGFPVCYTLWSMAKFPNVGNLRIGDQFASARKLKSSSIRTDQECKRDYVPPVLAFEAHTQPLDIEFDREGKGAYVSFHGSWRLPPVGFHVLYVPFENGRPRSEPAESRYRNATSFIIRNKRIKDCPDDCFRPVGLVRDSKDRLFFSSDYTGEVFVLAQKNPPTQTTVPRERPT
ncbi:l-sorbosone dehydrogenase [Fusarium beomiforme]|uniref:L-sorbosone dehydrogenase n=1 Tax=Fusarium beomiforme TaxID=44412 RepID=A0A9P5ASB0_9HYPO|nr:l-sorbosone dehydrogenase [Fusarium beomiforme]